jgi:biotin-dependent carboxylase-like uncharacterized protein
VIRVLRPGPLTTVQDLGRPGYGAWGIAPGGAADRRSLTLANRLVGNRETAAALELTGGGLHARFTRPAMVALTGANCPATVGGRAAAMNGPIHVPPDADLALGNPTRGLRTYLAVRGGLDTPYVLGSRATDLVAGLGTGALIAGDELPIGTQIANAPTVDLAPVADWPDPFVIPVITGPREDWFTPEALHVLTSCPYMVTPAANRVGIRLAGPPLHRRITAELPSEPVVRGAIEVPPDGRPILFLVDHPTTCGYPVIAVAEPDGADLAAQLRPGQQVFFRLSSIRPPATFRP